MLMKKLWIRAHCSSIGALVSTKELHRKRTLNFSYAGQDFLSYPAFKYLDDWLDGYGNIANALVLAWGENSDSNLQNKGSF